MNKNIKELLSRIYKLFIIIPFLFFLNVDLIYASKNLPTYEPIPPGGGFFINSLNCTVQAGATNAAVTCSASPLGFQGMQDVIYQCSGIYNLISVSGSHSGSRCSGYFSPNSVFPKFNLYSDGAGFVSILSASPYFLVNDTNNNCIDAGFTTVGTQVVTEVYMTCSTGIGGGMSSGITAYASAATAVANIPLVAGGEYINTSSIQYPILAVSTNTGSSWNYPVYSASSPSDINGTSSVYNDLKSISCSGIFCIASGQYFNNSGGFSAFVTQSSNGGQTWQYTLLTSTNPPPNSPTIANSNVDIESASCSQLVCVVGGVYKTAGGGWIPFLAVSQNGGASWFYPSISNTPNDITQTATGTTSNVAPNAQTTSITGVSCAGVVCAASGVYINTSNGTSPFILTSTNGGSTWSYTYSSSNAALISDLGSGSQQYAHLLGISCSTAVCVAAGQYYNTVGGISLYAVTSTNNGLTWTNSITSAGSYPADSPTAASQNGIFFGVSCNGTTCAISGEYKNNSNLTYPTVAYTTNSGAAWTYPIYSSPAIPNYAGGSSYTSSELNAVACNSSGCVAGGYYNNTSGGYSLLLASNVGGSWGYAITSSNQPADSQPALANQNNSFAFGGTRPPSVSCGGTTCLASGYYFAVSGNSSATPLVALSTNSGSTWGYTYTSANAPPDGGTLAQSVGRFYATAN